MKSSDEIFNFAQRASVSGWKNCCGFNSLAHFITYRLLDGQFDDQLTDPGFSKFLKLFNKYYHLGKPGIDYAELKYLLQDKAFHHPQEREKLLSPVMRKMYMETGVKSPDQRAGFWVEFSYIANDCFQHGKLTSTEPGAYELHAANANLIATLIRMYHANPSPKKPPFDDWLQQQSEAYAKKAHRNHLKYQADLKNNTMIGANELAALAAEFGVGVKTYSRSKLAGKVSLVSNPSPKDSPNAAKASASSPPLPSKVEFEINDRTFFGGVIPGDYIFTGLGKKSPCYKIIAKSTDPKKPLTITLEVPPGHTPSTGSWYRLNTYVASDLKKKYTTTMKVINDGLHWELELPTRERARQHNDAFDSYSILPNPVSSFLEGFNLSTETWDSRMVKAYRDPIKDKINERRKMSKEGGSTPPLIPNLPSAPHRLERSKVFKNSANRADYFQGRMNHLYKKSKTLSNDSPSTSSSTSPHPEYLEMSKMTPQEWEKLNTALTRKIETYGSDPGARFIPSFMEKEKDIQALWFKDFVYKEDKNDPNRFELVKPQQDSKVIVSKKSDQMNIEVTEPAPPLDTLMATVEILHKTAKITGNSFVLIKNCEHDPRLALQFSALIRMSGLNPAFSTETRKVIQASEYQNFLPAIEECEDLEKLQSVYAALVKTRPSGPKT